MLSSPSASESAVNLTPSVLEGGSEYRTRMDIVDNECELANVAEEDATSVPIPLSDLSALSDGPLPSPGLKDSVLDMISLMDADATATLESLAGLTPDTDHVDDVDDSDGDGDDGISELDKSSMHLFSQQEEIFQHQMQELSQELSPPPSPQRIVLLPKPPPPTSPPKIHSKSVSGSGASLDDENAVLREQLSVIREASERERQAAAQRLAALEETVPPPPTSCEASLIRGVRCCVCRARAWRGRARVWRAMRSACAPPSPGSRPRREAAASSPRRAVPR